MGRFDEPLDLEGRAAILPFRDSLPGSVMNEREWALPGMLAGAWNAFTAPRRAWTGQLDPTSEEAVAEALNVAGYGMLPGLGRVVAGARPRPGMLGANVWHGSPHKFDAFDAAHIGRGEGAQAYGHGLYFADNPGVAGYYSATVGKPLEISAAAKAELGALDNLGFDSASQAMGAIRSHPDWMRRWGVDPARDSVVAIREQLQKTPPKPTLYKVDLPDEMIGRMLDWDKPLSQQPESVRKALAPYFADDFTKVEPRDGMPLTGGGTLRVHNDPDLGPRYFLEWADGKRFRLSEKDLPNLLGAGGEGKAIYQSMKDRFSVSGGIDKDVSQWLRELGIPGIRYLDQGSRQVGKGTYNYVVFPGEEKALKILERQ